MKKGVLFLALLLMVSFVGCNNDEDITDTITQGTWRVSYFVTAGDEDTSLFNGYIFTFLANGTVTVVRPDAATAEGSWNEFNSNTRFELDFGEAGLLTRLNESWVVDGVDEEELLLHEVGAPLNQLELRKR